VYDLVEGKDLLSLFNSSPSLFDKHLIRALFFKVVEVVDRIHKKGVVHLDLKPENIMFDAVNHEFVLIDFGFAEFFQPSNPISVIKKSGSMEYCAPEIYFEPKYDGSKADVWSLGVLLFVLLFQKFPFQNYMRKLSDSNLKSKTILRATFDEKKKGEFVAPVWASGRLLSLFKGIFNPNPKLRFNTEQILNHEWFMPLQLPKIIRSDVVPSSQSQLLEQHQT